MSGWDEEEDAFLAAVPEADPAAGAIERLVVGAALEPIEPPPELRASLLAAATHAGRFARFAESVAELLDVSGDRARAILDGLDRPESWVDGFVPHTRLYHVEGGPRVAGAATGFVRMPRGATFPDHEHLGPEDVLVIQGSFVDQASGRIVRPGERATMAPGSSHGFVVRPGPALVYLVVLHDGLRIGDSVIRAADPRA